MGAVPEQSMKNGPHSGADMSPRQRPPRRRDKGQAAVEFAIALPIVLIAVLAIAQVAVVVRDQLALESAARAAARAASVTTDHAAAVGAGRSATRVDGIEISIRESGDTVTAVATRATHGLPIVGVAVSGRTQSAQVTMLIEPP